MDLNAYLLDDIVAITTPPGETAAAAQNRREAIGEMFRAYQPRDGRQAMNACQCIVLRFLLSAAMRHASNTGLQPDLQTRARVEVVSISRTLHQWVSKLEKNKQRDETRAAEARKSEANAAAAPKPLASEPPAAQPPTPPLIQPGQEPAPERPPMRIDGLSAAAKQPGAVAVPPPGNRPQVAVGARV